MNLLRIQDLAKAKIIESLKESGELTTTQIFEILVNDFEWKWGIDLVLDFLLINRYDFRLIDLNENHALWSLTDMHLIQEVN